MIEVNIAGRRSFPDIGDVVGHENRHLYQRSLIGNLDAMGLDHPLRSAAELFKINFGLNRGGALGTNDTFAHDYEPIERDSNSWGNLTRQTLSDLAERHAPLPIETVLPPALVSPNTGDQPIKTSVLGEAKPGAATSTPVGEERIQPNRAPVEPTVRTSPLSRNIGALPEMWREIATNYGGEKQRTATSAAPIDQPLAGQTPPPAHAPQMNEVPAQTTPKVQPPPPPPPPPKPHVEQAPPPANQAPLPKPLPEGGEPIPLPKTQTPPPPTQTSRIPSMPGSFKGVVVKGANFLSIVPVALDIARDVKHGNFRKAATTGGTFALITTGVAIAMKTPIGKAIPIAGGAYGAYNGFTQARQNFQKGNNVRGVLDSIKTAAYGTAAVAGVATAADCWNPTVVAPALVATGALAVGGAIDAGEAIYDNSRGIYNAAKGMWNWATGAGQKPARPTARPAADLSRVQPTMRASLRAAPPLSPAAARTMQASPTYKANAAQADRMMTMAKRNMRMLGMHM